MTADKAKERQDREPVPAVVKKGVERVLKESSHPWIPEGAKIVKIALSKPEFSRLPFVEAYAFTFNGDVPDAYFDEKWRLIVSVSGLISFDSENDKSARIAKASMKMAGIEEKKIDGKNAWFRLERDGTETRLDPFDAEGFELWNEVRFFENRIDFLRRLASARTWSKKWLPLNDAAIGEYSASGSITVSELSEIRALGGVTDGVYSRYAKTLATALPSQVSDPKFDRPYRFVSPDGKPAVAMPAAHGISESKIAEMLSSWLVSKEQASASVKAIRAKEAFLASFRETVQRNAADLQKLKREAVPKK